MRPPLIRPTYPFLLRSKRLQKMITTMRERMDAKCGNSNDNAFRIRKLFLAWDKKNSGMVGCTGR